MVRLKIKRCGYLRITDNIECVKNFDTLQKVQISNDSEPMWYYQPIYHSISAFYWKPAHFLDTICCIILYRSKPILNSRCLAFISSPFNSVGMMIRSPFYPDEYSDSHPKDENIIHFKNLRYVWHLGPDCICAIFNRANPFHRVCLFLQFCKK